MDLLKDSHGLRNIIDFLKEIYDKLDEGKATDVISLEFLEAFNNSRLVAKLEACGIGGIQWIKNC